MVNPISTTVSGLMAQSTKLAASAQNIVNADVTGSTDPSAARQAYQPVIATTVSVGTDGGVRTALLSRTPATIPIYSPDSPFADAEGMIETPNVNIDEELVAGKIAEQAYKANAQMIATTSRMHDDLMRALDEEA